MIIDKVELHTEQCGSADKGYLNQDGSGAKEKFFFFFERDDTCCENFCYWKIQIHKNGKNIVIGFSASK